MDLVDHEHLEASLHRLIHRLLQKCLHLVHTPVGCSIELGVVNKAPGINVSASRAYPTGGGGDAAAPVGPLAVERLGQNSGHRGLANAPRAGEQVGVVQPLRGQRIAQGLHHVALPHHVREIAGSVFAGEHQVRHKLPILRPDKAGAPT